MLARRTSARDFRAKHRPMLGEAPTLEKIAEGGEFRHGAIAEAAETYSVETFGRIISISRQAFVNDDIGAFTDLSRRLGVVARSFENAQVVAKLVANPAMSDGATRFDETAHDNAKAAGGSLDADLAAARPAMRRQTGLSADLIDVTPRYVLVPPDLETNMQKKLTAIQAQATENANPFSALTLLVEPGLSAAAQWYVAADPATIDSLEYAYLEGAPGPQIESRAGFEVGGIQICVRLDFGCGWVDHHRWFRVG
ncbi:MAG: hypothetical protein AAGC57_20340 [Pseudomonadota bacterium]